MSGLLFSRPLAARRLQQPEPLIPTPLTNCTPINIVLLSSAMELRETALARHVSATVQTRDGEATDSAVCLLLGWTGGNPTLLRKAYGQKYLDAGMHLVVIAAPVPPLSGAEATRTFQTAVNSETWKLLFDGKRKVVLHCFSNGGGINLFHLIRVTR